jgi:hypothetical protein
MEGHAGMAEAIAIPAKTVVIPSKSLEFQFVMF